MTETKIKNQVNKSLEFYDIMLQLNTAEGVVLFVLPTKQGTSVLSVHMKSKLKPTTDVTTCGSIY